MTQPYTSINTQSASEKQRAAFEKWVALNGYFPEQGRNGVYLWGNTNAAWRAWQAAIATLMPVLRQAEEALNAQYHSASDGNYIGPVALVRMVDIERMDKALAALREVIGEEK